MKRIIIILTILISADTNTALSQNNYNDSLLLLEESVFTATDTLEMSNLLFKKTDLCLRHNDAKRAFNELQRIEKIKPLHTYKKEQLWNAILLSARFSDYNGGREFLNRYHQQYDSVSIASNFLGFITFVSIDSLKARHYLKKMAAQNDSLACLDCFYKLVNYPYKKGTFYNVSSSVVPGSGLIFMGRPLKGFTAMAISAGFVASGIFFYNSQLFINGVGWTLGWGTRFYLGQYVLTDKEFEKKQGRRKNKMAANCKSDLDKQLKHYTIDYILLR